MPRTKHPCIACAVTWNVYELCGKPTFQPDHPIHEGLQSRLKCSLGRRIGASSTEPQTLPRGTIFGAMALFGELAPSLATWTTPTPACASQPARARGPKALGGRDARAPAFSHPAFFAGPSLASLTSLTRLSLSLASVAAAKSLSSRRATSSKGPPAWAAEDFRYVYPFSGGVEAFSFKPATKRYTIDFLRSSYFLILHVIAFACGPCLSKCKDLAT